MQIMTSQESKALTWDRDSIEKYPTWAELDTAKRSQFCEWYRYLRSPADADEARRLQFIIDTLVETYPRETAKAVL
jgi:chemotaxis regulatin CheY-phosphate phosphatase CheZ